MAHKYRIERCITAKTSNRTSTILRTTRTDEGFNFVSIYVSSFILLTEQQVAFYCDKLLPNHPTYLTHLRSEDVELTEQFESKMEYKAFRENLRVSNAVQFMPISGKKRRGDYYLQTLYCSRSLTTRPSATTAPTAAPHARFISAKLDHICTSFLEVCLIVFDNINCRFR